MVDLPVLTITGAQIPPYSYRGVTQTLEPIPAASQLARTVNGDLDDISSSLFEKFSSVITSNDMQVPWLPFPGTTVTVDCIAELSYLTTAANPQRSAVSGSEHVDGLFTFYRPQLVMKVVGYTINHDEWNAIRGWTLTLEEV